MERETNHSGLWAYGSFEPALSRLTRPTIYPAGAALTTEGDQSRGVVLILNGRAHLSIRTGAGDRLIVGIAEPGDVIGLSETITGRPYELTAIATEPCNACIVERDRFLAFLRDNSDACYQIMQRLSADVGLAYGRARSSAMPSSRVSRSDVQP